MTTTRIPTKLPEPTAATTPVVALDERSGRTMEDFADARREKDAAASQADMRAAFGEPIDEGRKVRWSVDMRERRNRGLWKELSTAQRRVKIERAGKLNARPKAMLTDRVTGQVQHVLVEDAERIGRSRNLKPAVHWGGCPVERGPDGMLFRRVSRRWEPTGRSCLGTPLDGSDPEDVKPEQESPSGELWIKGPHGWRCYGPVYDEVAGQ
jgi:hypothetical protein